MAFGAITALIFAGSLCGVLFCIAFGVQPTMTFTNGEENTFDRMLLITIICGFVLLISLCVYFVEVNRAVTTHNVSSSSSSSTLNNPEEIMNDVNDNDNDNDNHVTLVRDPVGDVTCIAVTSK